MPLQCDGSWLAPPSLSHAPPPTPPPLSFMLRSSLCPVPVSLTRRGGGVAVQLKSERPVAELSVRHALLSLFSPPFRYCTSALSSSLSVIIVIVRLISTLLSTLGISHSYMPD